MPRIFALGVLSNDDPIDVLRSDVAQRALHARQQTHRPNIGVLIKALADCKPQAPKRDMIRYVGRAHRTEQDGIEPLERPAPHRSAPLRGPVSVSSRTMHPAIAPDCYGARHAATHPRNAGASVGVDATKQWRTRKWCS
jgi:hypothetical protein